MELYLHSPLFLHGMVFSEDQASGRKKLDPHPDHHHQMENQEGDRSEVRGTSV
jgi:hypothetical protein